MCDDTLFTCLFTYQKTPSEDEDDIPSLPPLFITEFVLEPLQLTFAPDEEEFHDGLADVMKGFQDTVLRVQNLVPDNYFDAFTRLESVYYNSQRHLFRVLL